MKVSMQQKLIFLLASAFGFTALAAHVSLPAYISYQATLLRQKPPSTDRSIPSLPGKLPYQRGKDWLIYSSIQ